MKNLKNNQSGFTLIEILVVIGMIALLATIVIIAINPARQFAQGRNTQRTSNVNTILNAIGQNLADNKGVFNCPGVTITASAQHIGTGAVNLTCLTPTYIPTGIPTDPTNGTAADTQYTVLVDAVGRYTVCAPNANEAALGSPGPFCSTR
jgi:type IV pilus assembly protein PilA